MENDNIIAVYTRQQAIEDGIFIFARSSLHRNNHFTKVSE